MSDLISFILNVAQATNSQDGNRLKSYLTLYPRNEVPTGDIQAHFPEPNEFDLYQLQEKYRPVLKCHFKMMKAIYLSKSIKLTFDELNQMSNHLIRAAEAETNWINVVLMDCLTELLAVYRVRQQSYPEELSEYEQLSGEDLILGNTHSTAIEKLATTLNKAFKISLNDKNVDLSQSKRIDIYYYLSQLIKVYYMMDKFDLAKSIEKAIKGTKFKLPNINKSTTNKKYGITYLYYSAILALDDGDFVQAEAKLDQALHLVGNLANYQSTKQFEKILFILLPIKLYFGKIPKPFIWKYESIKLVYLELTNAVVTGNIHNFETCLNKYQKIFLRNHLFLLLELLKQSVYAHLVKNITKIVQLQMDPSSHIIPLSSYQIGFEISKFHTFDEIDWETHDPYFCQDEIECVIANLISVGKVKGYLSHGNRCLVLSKQNPFPTK